MEKNRTHPLRIGLLIMLTILFIGTLWTSFIPGGYKVPIRDGARLAAEMEGVAPHELLQYYNDDRKDAPLLVDMRPQEAFDAGHLPGATHLSPEKLSNKRQLKRLRKQPVWVYSDSEVTAHQATLYLQMVGVDARALNSHYTHLARLIQEEVPSAASRHYSEEKVRYNYKAHFPVFIPEPAEPILFEVAVPTGEGC